MVGNPPYGKSWKKDQEAITDSKTKEVSDPRFSQQLPVGERLRLVNIIVRWNTIYIEAILAGLRSEGDPVQDADAARVSPLGHHHINMSGRYFFTVPEAVKNGQFRPLNPQN